MEKIPDSKWIASLVCAAFEEGRYELGQALARLCGQALWMERERESALLPAVPVVAASVYTPEHRHVQAPEPAAPACGWVFADGVWVTGWSNGGHGYPCHYQLGHEGGHDAGVASEPAAADDGEPPVMTYSNCLHRPEHVLYAEPCPHGCHVPRVAVEDTPTAVTPSARCVYQSATGKECHGVLYWADSLAAPEGTYQGGWVHLDGNYRDHDPVADRPVER